MGAWSWRQRAVIGATVLVLVVGAFFVGRETAPDASAGPTTAPCTGGRKGISVPTAFGGPDGEAYFSLCEVMRARNVPFGEQSKAVNLYRDETGDALVAWWYPDCGLPEGVVAPHTEHPKQCDTTVTTGTADTTP